MRKLKFSEVQIAAILKEVGLEWRWQKSRVSTASMRRRFISDDRSAMAWKHHE
jgi:hypothetical protein